MTVPLSFTSVEKICTCIRIYWVYIFICIYVWLCIHMGIYGFVCVSLCIDSNFTPSASERSIPDNLDWNAWRRRQKDGLHLWRAIPRDVRRGAAWNKRREPRTDRQSDHCFHEVTIVPQKRGSLIFLGESVWEGFDSMSSIFKLILILKVWNGERWKLCSMILRRCWKISANSSEDFRWRAIGDGLKWWGLEGTWSQIYGTHLSNGGPN